MQYKGGSTREIKLHNKDDEGAILSGTSYRNSTHISEVSTGNTEQDSNTGEWYEEDGDTVILAETRYNKGIHTSGENKNDTGPNNGTLLHDPFNYSAGIITSDATYTISMLDKGTYNSDEDTGYGESKDILNEERHTWETEKFSRNTCSPSVTASPARQTRKTARDTAKQY